LKIINEEFYDAYTRTDLMATAVILSYDPATKAYEQANAGHTPTLVRQGGDWHLLKASAPPIGVLPDLNVISQSIVLNPGDVVVGYSDGFSEIETSTGLWSEAGLIGAVPDETSPATVLVQDIVGAARQVSIHSELQDDQTLIVLTLTEGV
jgi:sigma-B regulation protein RsbU (phosphoserine phosphatase)